MSGFTPVPKPDPTEKNARKPLRTLTPIKRGSSSLSRRKPIKAVNRERLDKRTKEYKRYMASHAWKLRRVVAILIADFRCQRCGWTPPPGVQSVREIMACKELHVHHRTYARFGNEQPEDLEVICSHCHEQEHAGRFIKPRGLRGGR